MDINLLSKMLKELVMDNDRVGLPSFGTFVAELVPATFSDKGYTINPPYRRLLFYSSMLEEDLLVNLYASSNGISEADSRIIISECCGRLKTKLEDDTVLAFPGLGKLRQTREGNVFFICDEDLNIYPDGFGLQPISLKSRYWSETCAPEPSTAAVAEAPVEEPAPEQTSVQTPAQTPEQTPVQTPPPAPEQTLPPAPTPSPEPVPVPSPAPAPQPVMRNPEEDTVSHGWRTALVVVLIVAALLLAGFVILARLAPGFVDSILYTPEELEILKWSNCSIR